MRVKLLTEHSLEFLNLKGGCTGSSESTLVKMPHCLKSCVTAHLSLFCPVFFTGLKLERDLGEMGLDERKLVFGVSNKVRFKPAWGG